MKDQPIAPIEVVDDTIANMFTYANYILVAALIVLLSYMTIRDFLKKHEGKKNPQLLMDKLPVGKIQESAWEMSVVEQAQLLARLQQYAETETDRNLLVSPSKMQSGTGP